MGLRAGTEMVEVEKSPNDKRSYRALHLPNGLQVLLIHDPDIDVNATEEEPAHSRVPGMQREEDVASVVSGSDSEGSEEEDDEGSSDASSDGDSEEEGEEEEDGHRHVHPHGPRGAGHPAKPVKKTAAALSVGIGYLSDPWHAQGLSHFLEHMLFMGSERFPDENDYDAFLTAQGGSSNACTEEECTTYFFDVKPSSLKGALDRFAQFFIAPLVKSDALEREVQAVDNEFSGVLQSDECRTMQLKCHTSRDGHVYRKFGWGNKKSLMEDTAAAGLDMRAELLAHYKAQYGAERMKLVILGGESLDVLQEWASELFAAVPAGVGPRPDYQAEGFPFEGGRLHLLRSVKEEHKLHATFQLPCLNQQYRKKAEEYLSHLIGHEGPGSLLSALKARGWASELCAGVSDQSTVTWLFDVTITLTQAGLDEGPGCGLATAELLFGYLAMLRAAGPQRWVFDEQAAVANMRFRFREEEDASDYVMGLSTDMHVYPPEHIISAPFLHDDWDPQLVSELLGTMLPSNARLDLQTSLYDVCKGLVLDAMPNAKTGVEPWFDFEFIEAALPKPTLQGWAEAAPTADMKLPSANGYIATDFSLLPSANGNAAAQEAAADDSATFPGPPALVLDVPGLRAWHKVDATFHLPRTNAYFKVVPPEAYADPRRTAMTHLLIKLLEDALCETAYLADVAGLHYNIWFEGRQGFDIKIDGFSHKLPVLTAFVFKTLAELSPQTDAFARVKEALLRQYRNINMKPYKHATYLRLGALKDVFWRADDILKEMELVSAADLAAFLPQLLADIHIEALLHGNINAADAERLAQQVHSLLGSRRLSAEERPVDRTVQLPPGHGLVYRAAAKNAEEENSVAEVYFQCGTDTAASRALVDMVEQLVHEPCYDQLRTKEQLGYTVHSGMRLTHGVLGFCIVVVSGVYAPSHLDSRVEAFLEAYAERLGAMTEEEFEEQRGALLAAKLMKDRNMVEESDRSWEAIAARRYNFHARREEVEQLRGLTLQAVTDFYARHLRGAARRKLSVHIVGKGHTAEVSAPAPEGMDLVADPFSLKTTLPLYPALIGTAAADC